MLQFDERTAKRVEEIYSTPDVVAQREAVRAALALRAGERALDIGSGPGFLTAEMAADVGPEGTVHGVDVSESMLAIARRRELAPSSARVELQAADAAALPFPDASFDAVVSTQVYEYVADIPGALAEARRVLVPGGRLLVLDTDWDSVVWHSGDPARMQRVLAAWDEHLADPYLPRRLPGELRAAGFTLTKATVVPILNRGFDNNTYSAGLIEIVAAFVGGRGGVSDEEAGAWATELAGRGDDYFFSLSRYLFVAVG
jgi:arsenite methyltransferase